MDDNYESVNAEGSAELEKMPKPMAVRIVEDLAWMYVGLALSMTVFATVRAILDPHASAKFVWPIGLPFVLLTLAMQWALRRGRSSWFILPHYVFWLALACPSLLLSLFRVRAMDLVLFFGLTTALVVVTWLLLLSDSRKWCADVRARHKKDVSGCMVLLAFGTMMALMVCASASPTPRSAASRANGGSHSAAICRYAGIRAAARLKDDDGFYALGVAAPS